MAAMFSKPKVPKPVIPKPVPMVDETALAKAKQKKMLAASSRGGRQSTILTQGDTLGG